MVTPNGHSPGLALHGNAQFCTPAAVRGPVGSIQSMASMCSSSSHVNRSLAYSERIRVA